MDITAEIEMYFLQKQGELPETYEDAAKYSIGEKVVKIAVGDGATTAHFSKLWVNILTDFFVANTPFFVWGCGRIKGKARRLSDWLLKGALEWKSHIDYSKLPSHVFKNLQKGSFATLLGLHLHLTTGFYRLVAIGDCNVVLVRDDKIILAWPIEKPEDFGTSPGLVYTNPDMNKNLSKKLKIAKGRFQVGDTFLLASDVMAHHILQYGLPSVSSQEEFELFVEQERKAERMRNDDMTLLRVKVIEKEA